MIVKKQMHSTDLQNKCRHLKFTILWPSNKHSLCKHFLQTIFLLFRNICMKKSINLDFELSCQSKCTWLYILRKRNLQYIIRYVGQIMHFPHASSKNIFEIHCVTFMQKEFKQAHIKYRSFAEKHFSCAMRRRQSSKPPLKLISFFNATCFLQIFYNIPL